VVIASKIIIKDLRGLNKDMRDMVAKTFFGKRNSVFIAVALLIFSVASVYAANTPDLTQTISAGSLTTDIRDASRVPVGSPAVAFSGVTFSFDCLSGASRPSGTFGTGTERIYVDNPDAADDGWTLAFAATGGATEDWDDAGSNNYDFNDPGGAPAGCGDGGDADSEIGQLSVDPTTGSTTTDCGSCGTTGITLGSASAYNQGTVDSITLVNAAAGSDDIGRWYFTGLDLDQTIPAEQPPAAYTLNMTLTVTAL